MTLKSEVFAAMQEARDLAAETYTAVQLKAMRIAASPTLWFEKTRAEGMWSNAATNLATIELLPEILDDALQTQDPAVALRQALVVIEQTGEATVKYAEWAESFSLATMARGTWAALIDLVGQLARAIAEAVVEVGGEVVKGLGLGGVIAAAVGLGVVIVIATR
jgi:hypothetical protein